MLISDLFLNSSSKEVSEIQETYYINDLVKRNAKGDSDAV